MIEKQHNRHSDHLNYVMVVTYLPLYRKRSLKTQSGINNYRLTWNFGHQKDKKLIFMIKFVRLHEMMPT